MIRADNICEWCKACEWAARCEHKRERVYRRDSQGFHAFATICIHLSGAIDGIQMDDSQFVYTLQLRVTKKRQR